MCDEMLVDCWYGGMAYNCSRMFQSILIEDGICCSFNMMPRAQLFKKQ